MQVRNDRLRTWVTQTRRDTIQQNVKNLRSLAMFIALGSGAERRAFGSRILPQKRFAMSSVSRSLMNCNRTSARIALAMKNYGLRASNLSIVLGLVLMGSQLLTHPLSAQQTGGLPAWEQRVAALEAALASAQQKNTDLAERLAAVEAKTVPISVDGNDFKITGKNVFIQDGSGQTNGQTGLGNLTIGYNALRDLDAPNVRTGTHNLIVGDENNYTSFGGLVAGFANEISNGYASVSGGIGNSARGYWSSISGGESNICDGLSSSISGGANNRAFGAWSSVSGGASRHVLSQTNWRAGELFEEF